MPMSWTHEQDRRLLLLVLEALNAKVDKQEIADLWKKKYGSDGGEQPTARAIKERLFKLKGMTSGGGEGTPSKSKSTLATPSTATKTTPKAATKATPSKLGTAKSPTTSARKRRASAMSDEDNESESDTAIKHSLAAGLPPREKSSRRSKTPRIPYSEVFKMEESEIDGDGDGEHDVSAQDSAVEGGFKTKSGFRPLVPEERVDDSDVSAYGFD